jgi:hypothetical protein
MSGQRNVSSAPETAPAPGASGQPPVHPVPAPAPKDRRSLAEPLAAVLKLASACCGLAAAVLFVLPTVNGTFSPKPQLLTLTPVFSDAKDSPPVPDARPEEKAPAEGKGVTGADPFVAPPQPVAEPDDVIREEHANFKGAILMLESEPEEALVFVDGKEQGETPVSVGLECTPGKPVHVEFALRGYARAKHDTVCPKDMMVKLTARLKKKASKRP